MICYRDMTFCSFGKNCLRAITCPRVLNADVRRAAKRAGLPVARFLEKPDCYREKDTK